MDVIWALASSQDSANPTTVWGLVLDLRSDKAVNHPFTKTDQSARIAASRWPYSNVRSLTFLNPGEAIDYTSIPLFFPLLEQLHLKFPRSVSSSSKILYVPVG